MATRLFNQNTAYLSESQSLFSRMTSSPSGTRKSLIDCTIYQLKSAGIWNELDAIWFLAAADSQVAKLNWKSSSFNCTELGTMNFVADRGYTRNGAFLGTTDALNTNYNPSTNATKYAINNHSYGVYIRSNIVEAAADFGALNSSNVGIQINTSQTATTVSSRDSSSLGGGFTVTSPPLGLTSLVRNASTTYNAYKNGIASTPVSVTSVSTPNFQVYLCAANVNNAVAAAATKQMAFAYIGSANIDQVALYSIVQFYMTGLGAAV